MVALIGEAAEQRAPLKLEWLQQLAAIERKKAHHIVCLASVDKRDYESALLLYEQQDEKGSLQIKFIGWDDESTFDETESESEHYDHSGEWTEGSDFENGDDDD